MAGALSKVRTKTKTAETFGSHKSGYRQIGGLHHCWSGPSWTLSQVSGDVMNLR